MRSVDRCKESFQGDRCNFARGHEGTHESNNVVWTTSAIADSYAVEKHPRKAPRRNRAQNRFVKDIVLHGVIPEFRPQAIKALKAFEDRMRGAQ